MEKSENQEVKKSRELLKSRLSKRFPERKFVGEDGNDAQDAIDDSLEEMINEYESTASEHKAHSKRLTDLFYGDPRAAKLFMNWASGGNLMENLIETYGDDFRNALDSEEGRGKFIDAHNRWMEKVAKDNEANKEADENFAQSIKTLDAFQQKHNLSDEDAIAVFDKVHKMYSDAVRGIYSEESFLMALNAINHDSDVASARVEGEIAGRNAKIKEKVKSGDDMKLPPSLSGQGAAIRESRPSSKKRTALDMFGLNE